MKKFTLLPIAVFLMNFSFGQVSGTFTIPGATYSTIASAIAALNTSGAGEGGAIFNVTAGYTETFASPADGYLTIPVNPPTLANQVIFQKSGEGPNPRITAAAGTGTMDAMIAISGLNYITFDGIDLQESTGNTTTGTQMEWGYAILKASGTQGSSNIKIANCTISLNNTNIVTYGIYSNNHTTASTAQLIVSAVSGQNSDNKFYGNTITNSYGGIYLYGYADLSAGYPYYDQNNDIGSAAGNTVNNFGGGATDEYLVTVYYQNNLTIANSNISGTGTGNGSIYGIYGGAASNANADIYGNTVSIVQSLATTGTIYGIYIPYTGLGTGGTNNTLNIYNNTVQNCSEPRATTAVFYGIYQFSPVFNINFYGNLVNNNVFAGSQYMYLCVSYGGVATGAQYVYNNTVSNNQRSGAGTQSGTAYVYCLWVQGSARTVVHDNQVFNNSIPGQVSQKANLYGLYIMPGNVTVYNNTIHDQMITSSYSGTAPTNTLYGGIYLQPSYHANNSLHNNTVYNLTINLTGGGTGLIYGIWTNNTDTVHDNLVYNLNVNSSSTGFGYGYGYYYSEATAGHTGVFYRNQLNNVKMDGSGAYFHGAYIHNGTGINVYNNYISDLKTPSSSNPDGVNGIYVRNNNTVGIYYNTVHLNTTSSSTGIFYSACVHYAPTANPSSLDMRNNILVNLSTAPGSPSYVAAAYRRSTSFGSYSTQSDRNDFYAGTAGPTNLIYYDAAHSLTTLAAYQAFVAPSDANSFTENPPFVDVTTTPYNLHIQTNVATLCESGGAPVTIPAINSDYDADPRYPNPGYPDNSYQPATAPDVGADEFAGGLVVTTKTLGVRLLVEGFYDNATHQMNKAQECLDGATTYNKYDGTQADIVNIYLVQDLGPSWPDPIPYDFSATNVPLDVDGTLQVTGIPGTISGNYYIIIKHRQGVETWSATPVPFSGSTINYDFAISAGKAYGNNQKQVDESPASYAVYSGDISSMTGLQDGYIDIFDNNDVFNDAQLGGFGYKPQDLTGDAFVDIFDMAIVFNNMQMSVGMITPPYPGKK